MNTRTHEPETLAICADCLQVLANGELGDEEHRSTEDVVADIDAQWLGVEITLGRIRDAEVVEKIHSDMAIGCPYISSRVYWDLDQEDESANHWKDCICEDLDDGWFSWHSCHACDSRLGGNRFYATAWLQIDEETI